MKKSGLSQIKSQAQEKPPKRLDSKGFFISIKCRGVGVVTIQGGEGEHWEGMFRSCLRKMLAETMLEWLQQRGQVRRLRSYRAYEAECRFQPETTDSGLFPTRHPSLSSSITVATPGRNHSATGKCGAHRWLSFQLESTLTCKSFACPACNLEGCEKVLVKPVGKNILPTRKNTLPTKTRAGGGQTKTPPDRRTCLLQDRSSVVVKSWLTVSTVLCSAFVYNQALK